MAVMHVNWIDRIHDALEWDWIEDNSRNDLSDVMPDVECYAPDYKEREASVDANNYL